MTPVSRATIQVQDWLGLQTNVGPSSSTPGAVVELVNLRVIVTGELAAREGIRRVEFDEEE